MSQQRVLGDEGALRPRQVGEGSYHERGSGGFGQGQEMAAQALQTRAHDGSEALTKAGEHGLSSLPDDNREQAERSGRDQCAERRSDPSTSRPTCPSTLV